MYKLAFHSNAVQNYLCHPFIRPVYLISLSVFIPELFTLPLGEQEPPNLLSLMLAKIEASRRTPLQLGVGVEAQ